MLHAQVTSKFEFPDQVEAEEPLVTAMLELDTIIQRPSHSYEDVSLLASKSKEMHAKRDATPVDRNEIPP